MAAVHGKDVMLIVYDVLGASRNISPDLNNVTFSHTRDNPTITTFGQNTESRIAGIRDGQLTGAGIFNSACANLGAASILGELMSSSLNTLVRLLPAGSRTGSLQYSACMLVSQYETQGANNAPVGISFTFQMSSGSVTESTV